ncbi:Ig-like domain-containing protein, partial [Pantoea sp. GM01]|uniref:Ig-like domain-containing protein n=1 Tax=Pantoea sp. GM01 TaxID=1144320 RepID=UPI001EE66F2C
VIDEAGNTSGEQPGIDFTVDTSRLDVSITHVADDEGSIQGNVASGGKTDDTTPTVHGRATPNSIVTIYVDDVAIGTVRTNAFGFWEQELALTEGTYAIKASVTNASGTTTTNEFSLEIDTTAPNRAVIDSVIDDVGADQGNVPNGGKTDDSTPTVEGRGVPGDIVTVYVDDIPQGTRVVREDGTWSFTLPPQEDGVKQISVSFTDEVGNEGDRSADWEITIDTVPPAGAITAATNNSDPAVPVDVAEGGYTFDQTPVFSGIGEEGATVRLYDQTGRLLGTTIVTGGVWQIESALLTEGPHVVKAVFDDGVYQVESAEWAINIDITLPTGTIDQIYDDNGRDTGPLASGDRTDDRTPTLSGTAEPFAWVYIYDGAGTTVLGSGQANAAGVWEFDVAVPRDGTYNFTAQFVDRAGNESTTRADSWPITIDTTPPTVGRITNAYDDFGASTGNVANGGSTDDVRPTYRGTGEEGSIVRLWEGATEIGSAVVTGGTWEITPNRDFVGTGLHTVTATFEDDLGNRGGHSPGYAVNIGPDFTLPRLATFMQLWEGSNRQNGIYDLPTGQTNLNIDLGRYHTQTDTPDYVRVGFWGGLYPVPGLTMYIVVNGTRHTLTHAAATDYGVWHTSSFNFLTYQNGSFSMYIEASIGGNTQRSPTYTATVSNRTRSTFSIVEPDDDAVLASAMVEKDEAQAQHEELPKEAVSTSEAIADEDADNDEAETVSSEEVVAEVNDPESVTEAEAALLASAAEVEGTEGEIDTWEITGSDLVIDLAKYAAALESVEVIDITGDGDNTLNISLGDILVHGEKDLFVADGKVQMMVKGNEGDVVNLSDLLPDGSDTGDWNAGENVWVDGVEYTVYAHTGQAAEVLIQMGVQTNLENH